jgi:hypothetical protein
MARLPVMQRSSDPFLYVFCACVQRGMFLFEVSLRQMALIYLDILSEKNIMRKPVYPDIAL